MELDSDEPGMVGPLDDLWQLAVGRHARKDKSALFERLAIMDVDLVAMAVALADVGRPILLGDLAVMAQFCSVGAQSHRAAHVGVRATFLQPFGTHPFGDQANHRLAGLAELGGRGLADPCGISRAFDAGHLHSKANAEEGHLALACETHAGDLALAAALTEPTWDE